MEVSYPQQAALPVERSKGFTMYREPLDYYSAVCPVFPQRLWESQEEEHCSVLHSFSKGWVFFPLTCHFSIVRTCTIYVLPPTRLLL